MSYMKQNKKRKQTLESPQYGQEINFKESLSHLYSQPQSYSLLRTTAKVWGRECTVESSVTSSILIGVRKADLCKERSNLCEGERTSATHWL